MPRIDTAQQLALVKAERDGVIGLTRPGLPRRLLAGEHDRQAIQIGDHAAIDGLIESEQPCLVREELADGHLFFSLLRELRPVRGNPLFVVEPAARVGDGQGHRGQALGGRVHEDHRVPLPRLTRLLVANTAPEVDDLLAVNVGAAGAAEFVPSIEVVGKRSGHRLEATTDVSLYCV